VKLNHDVAFLFLRLPLSFFIFASVIAFKPDDFQLFMRLRFRESCSFRCCWCSPNPETAKTSNDCNHRRQKHAINALHQCYASSIVIHIIAVLLQLCLAISVTLQKPVTKAAFICHHLDSVLSSILLCTLECMMSTIKRCNDAQISSEKEPSMLHQSVSMLLPVHLESDSVRKSNCMTKSADDLMNGLRLSA
jgi:hypothetical protein